MFTAIMHSTSLFPLLETFILYYKKNHPTKMLGDAIVIKPLALFMLGHTFVLLFLQNQVLEWL